MFEFIVFRFFKLCWLEWVWFWCMFMIKNKDKVVVYYDFKWFINICYLYMNDYIYKNRLKVDKINSI